MFIVKCAQKFNKQILYLRPYTVSKHLQIPFRRYSNTTNPPSRGGGGKVLLTLGALTVAGGATLAYAEYDPNFRNKLKEHLPFTEPIFETIDGLSLSKLYDNAKQLVTGPFSIEEKPKTLKQTEFIEPKAATLQNKPAKSQDSDRAINPDQKDQEIPKPKVVIVSEPKEKSNEVDTKSLSEIEAKVDSLAIEAVNACSSAIRALSNYNRDVERIIDEATNDAKPDQWENLRDKTRAKNESIRQARAKVAEASNSIKQLKELISQKNFSGSKSVVQDEIAKLQNDLEKANNEMELQIKRSSVTERYWDKVDKARKHFAEQLEILFPNIDLDKKRLSVNEEELDLFLLHVYNNLLFYQKELAKAETVMRDSLEDALKSARQGDFQPLTEAQVREVVEQERRKLQGYYQNQVLKLKKESESELRNQLKRQSQTFNDHLGDAVKVKEAEIDRLLSRKFDEELERERLSFKTQLAAVTGKLRGLDDAVKARNEAHASSKQAQVLWSACQSLLRTIKVGYPGISWKEQIKPLEPELNAVLRAAAANDELVSVVVQAIPKEVRDRGVYPEDALRERFFEVAKTARSVALVPAEGASLPVHILSYLESLLLIESANPISRAELNDESTDFSNLDTNDILQRARYWLDRGDFSQTLKYMNLLQGAPRRVASQWMNEARMLLEAQQAANTLMAHAASSGLVYL